jgi:hypothetical protein
MKLKKYLNIFKNIKSKNMLGAYSLNLNLGWYISEKNITIIEQYVSTYLIQKETIIQSVPIGYDSFINQSLIQITSKGLKKQYSL